MNTGNSDRDQIFQALGLVTGIGLYFAACLCVGLGLGWLISRFVGGGWLPLGLGFVVGVAAGGRGVYRMARDASRS